MPTLDHPSPIGPEKGVITKGVFSLEESLESLKSLVSLESLENGRILLYFPQSGGSLNFLGFPKFSREWPFLKRPLFQKTPFSEPDPRAYLSMTHCVQCFAMVTNVITY